MFDPWLVTDTSYHAHLLVASSKVLMVSFQVTKPFVNLKSNSALKSKGRDTGNDFFVSQISGGSVKFPGTCIVG